MEIMTSSGNMATVLDKVDHAEITDTSTPKKRTRTGCLKCRVRRRKCDEQKPRCKRCVDGDFECRWPSGLKFLSKNVLTITTHGDNQQVPRKYMKVQFLDTKTYRTKRRQTRNLVSISDTPSAERSGTPGTWPADAPITPLEKIGDINNNENNGSSIEIMDLETRDGILESGAHCDMQGQDPEPIISVSETNISEFADGNRNYVEVQAGTWIGAEYLGPTQQDELYDLTQTSMPVTTSTSAEHHGFSMYETALEALVSLGASVPLCNNVPDLHSSSGCSSISSRGAPDMQHPATVITTFGSLAATPKGHVDSWSESYPAGRSAQQDDGILGSNLGVLDLLRHFRYEVACWLDITDLSHPFGIHLPQLATKSERLFWALLELSGASILRHRWEFVHNLSVPMHVMIADCTTGDGAITKLVVLLQTLRSVMLMMPPYWGEGIGNMYQHLHRHGMSSLPEKLEHASLCLLLRIDIAHSLCTNKPLQPLTGTLITRIDLTTPTHPLQALHATSLIPLLLLARTLLLLHSDLTPSSPTTWKSLLDSLTHWYDSRPPQFYPMLTIPSTVSTSDPFPLFVFTSPIASFSNALYHTAMLLLLKNKPRTVRVDNRKSNVFSPVWHAQRVCGLAQGNKGRESWDWTMIGGLMVAGRMMTYELQQVAVLGILAEVHRVTGWEMGWFERELKEGWMT